MDSWPIDDRIQFTDRDGRKGKSKTKQKAIPRNYPDLHPGSNVVTLVERNGVLEWSFLAKNTFQEGLKLRIGECKTIFPPTRPTSNHTIKTTVLQSTERGANFLRTYHPDVDVPAELIRGELLQDAQNNERLKNFDPYLGNLLEPVVTGDATALAFPMGELNHDLNLSLFGQSKGRTTFEPSTRSAYKFDTPIQQISASSRTNGLHNYLAVRTFGLTSLLEATNSRAAPKLEQITVISHADTAGRALVDILLVAPPLEALAVNDLGSLYQCTVSSDRKHISLFHSPSEDINTRDAFWRLSRGTNSMNCLLVSKDALTQFDLRINKAHSLFLLPETRDVLTCVEDQYSDHIVKLCSTREILWVDSRFPGKPLLGYRHGRRYDRSLQVHTSPTSPALTLLSSRDNAMVTVYDVSRSEGQLLHVNAPPYYFVPGRSSSVSHLGQAFFSSPLDLNSTFSLVRLSEHGSLYHVDLSMTCTDASVFETSWSREVKEFENEPLIGSELPYDDQAFIETDFSLALDHIFKEYLNGTEGDIDTIYDIMETISAFWQDAEPPVQHMLTTYDVVFRAGDEPHQLSRAEFLTESAINTRSGYQAMAQGHLSSRMVAQGAARHHNIMPTLQHLGLTLSNDVQTISEALSQHDLVEDAERSTQSIKWENEAREQVALDMMLSTDIYSSQPVSKSSQIKVELEDMTKSLSLDGEYPSIEFGHLQPISTNHYRNEDGLDELTTSTGVRSLLKDWDVGADVENYEFIDYHTGSSERTRPPKVNQENNKQSGTQSQRPPKILATTTAPSQPGQKLMAAQSQDTPLARVVEFDDLGYSHDMVASTQILPGVHGGRPMMSKKRLIKKRIGGF